jgi:hypothetical protein
VAPAASPFFRKERRLVAIFMLLHMFSITAPLAKPELAKQSLNLQHNDRCHQNVKRGKNLVTFSSRDHDQK